MSHDSGRNHNYAPAAAKSQRHVRIWVLVFLCILGGTTSGEGAGCGFKCPRHAGMRIYAHDRRKVTSSGRLHLSRPRVSNRIRSPLSDARDVADAHAHDSCRNRSICDMLRGRPLRN
jgi:hypothetical protein